MYTLRTEGSLTRPKNPKRCCRITQGAVGGKGAVRLMKGSALASHGVEGALALLLISEGALDRRCKS